MDVTFGTAAYLWQDVSTGSSFTITQSGTYSVQLTNGDCQITYVGGMGPHRGLDIVIKGIQILLEKSKQFHLNLVGSGHPDVVNKLKTLTEELNLSEHVTFHGQRPFSEVLSFMSVADINIIPHISNEHTDNTIPHKLFQIMMSEKPLLVSSSPTLARVTRKYDAGWIFDAGNPRSFASKIHEITCSQELAKKKCENALEAAMGELSWENEQIKLIKLMDSIFGIR